MTTLKDLAWLEGKWGGEAFGGYGEEIWTSPKGGCIIGMYRNTAGEDTQVLEFLIIEECAGEISLRFKHFTRWYETKEKEAPLFFVFKEVKGGAYIFESPVHKSPKRISYRLTDEGKMHVTVERESEDGTIVSFETLKERLT
jgi:hypothetical protein